MKYSDAAPPLRILHCPTNVGGNPQGLAAAERGLGLDARAVSFHQTTFQYAIDELIPVETGPRWRRELCRWRFLRRALREYDVVHFNFGRSIFPVRVPFEHASMQAQRWPQRLAHAAYSSLFELRDLRWLKRAGVGIVVTYQGDDARQGDYLRTHFDISPVGEVERGYYGDADDACKRRRIRIVDRYADRIYALNPDLLHVLPPRAEFLPYASVDPREWRPPHLFPSNARPVVLHAPSHRGVKGTRFVLDAVRRLQEQDRLDFELVLVENLPHAEARRLYERADLLIDQLLVGWYGALAVELMALGKPVMCYLRDDDLRFLPAAMRADIPIINAAPTTIYDALKEWLTVRRGELSPLGRQSRAYVQRWHDPRTIAARLAQAYQQIAQPPARATRPLSRPNL